MIIKENFSEEHIREIQNENRRDPLLIERTLFAFGLLEALVKVGLPFTFKGGTSLMLLLPRPMRLSTDIDIMVDPGTDIDGYIEKAKAIFPFIDGGEQELTKREIKNDILLTEGENLVVDIPTVDCILGDKLTAFAPHTTGIKFGKKNLEVMKQFFDVSTLIDEFTDFECVLNTYRKMSETEIAYREIDCTPQKALMDSITAGLCIGSRGSLKKCSRLFLTHVPIGLESFPVASVISSICFSLVRKHYTKDSNTHSFYFLIICLFLYSNYRIYRKRVKALIILDKTHNKCYNLST